MQKLLALSVLALAAFMVTSNAAECADDRPVRIDSVRLGFDGKFKVGHWVPMWIKLVSAGEDAEGTLEVTTTDCDDVPVAYRDIDKATVRVPAGQTVEVLRYVKFGRTQFDMTIRLVGENRLLAERKTSSARLHAALLSTDQLVVTLGNDAGAEDAVQRRAFGGRVRPHHVLLDSSQYLPDTFFGYSTVDSIVATTSRAGPLEKMSDGQFDAMLGWLKLGGQLVICAATRCEEVFAPDTRLSELAPGADLKMISQRTTSGIENYAGTTESLDSVGGSRVRRFTVSMADVTKPRGLVESQESGVTGGSLPTIIRFPFGFGQIVFVGFDLDQAPFAEWHGRPALVESVLFGAGRDRSDASDRNSSTPQVSHVGYKDLAGQLRSALDQFAGVKPVQFSWVAGLIVLYVIVIGPIDYFVLRKLGRPHWTWLTFTSVAIVFCAIGVWGATRLRGDSVHINQLDLVDIDAASGQIRGTTWANLYSPSTRLFDLSASAAPPLQAAADPSHGTWLTWHGLPGKGLGGFDTQTALALFSDPYEISQPAESHDGSISKMPVQIAGSKSLTVAWWATAEACEGSALTIDRNGLLVGEVTNPLSFDLNDCIVVYENWAYPLSGTIAAGESTSLKSLTPRNLQWRLTRRRVVDTRDVSTPWDDGAVDVPRILEIMMFYQAAGGEVYTNLTNQYQAFVDLSQHLRIGRAILIGRATQPAVTVGLDATAEREDSDRHWTYYRIVMPVAR